MATDLFLEMAELPATGSLGTGQLDTRDLLVAGVPISISSKYLYLYLALKLLTPGVLAPPPRRNPGSATVKGYCSSTRFCKNSVLGSESGGGPQQITFF